MNHNLILRLVARPGVPSRCPLQWRRRRVLTGVGPGPGPELETAPGANAEAAEAEAGA